VSYKKVKHLSTIRKIPDKLWNEIKILLSSEKPKNTIGHPIVPFRRVLDGILYVLSTGCQWKMLPKGRTSKRQSGLCYYVMMIYISDSNLLRIRYSWDMT
jgi:Transposase and inactivated derivatives